jgi:hypothetical protein
VDFGIPIDFDQMNIYPRSQTDAAKPPGHNCAIGRIRYSAVDGSTAPDGIIVYIKPACYGDEPRDIYEYFKRSETFPHESTADQFFSESQFESYRMLGAHTGETLRGWRRRFSALHCGDLQDAPADSTARLAGNVNPNASHWTRHYTSCITRGCKVEHSTGVTMLRFALVARSAPDWDRCC